MLGVSNLTPQQVQICRDVVDALNGKGPRKIIYPSGHGLGKSFIIAYLAIWLGCTGEDGNTRIVTTAPSWHQVKDILWKEINNAVDRSRLTGVGTFNQYKFKLNNRCDAEGVSTNDPVKMQGRHAPVFVLMLDEGPGIEKSIFDTITQGLTVNEDYLIISPGNPVEPTGWFADASRNSSYRVRHLSCLEHPNVINRTNEIPGAVSYSFCESMVEDNCEPIDNDASKIVYLEETRQWMLENRPPYNSWAHSIFDENNKPQGLYWNPEGWEGPNYFRPNNVAQSRMLGEFPEEGDDVLIPLRWVERAMMAGEPIIRKVEEYLSGSGEVKIEDIPEWNLNLPAIVAMDVARQGLDSTVIGGRRGRVVLRCREYRQMDTYKTAHELIRFYHDLGAESAWIDNTGGYGSSALDMIANEMQHSNVNANAVDFGSSPRANDQKGNFLNRRAEMYWNLRMMLMRNEVLLPRDEGLMSELCSIKYSFTAKGQIQLESKKKMKERLHKSPDRADMLVMLMDPDDGSWVEGESSEIDDKDISEVNQVWEMW